MKSQRADPTFTNRFEDLLSKEDEYIAKRRASLDLTDEEWITFSEKISKITNVKNHKITESVGLALSGGGIRSATFNLGFLQGLSRYEVLKFCDYISTVSGGGYIGCCLSSLLENPQTNTRANGFPFRFDRKNEADERQEVKWLRRYGNYLFPNRGFFSLHTWSFVALLITGILIINIPTFSLTVFSLYILKKTVGLLDSPYGFAITLLTISASVVAIMVLLRGFLSVLDLNEDRERNGNGLIAVLAITSFLIAGIGSLILLAFLLPRLESTVVSWIKTSLSGISLVTFFGLTVGLFSEKDKGDFTGKVLNVVFLSAQIAVLPLIIAWMIHYAWSGNALEISLLGVPVVVVIALLLFVLAFTINLNRISMHHFYRDRLSKAYIIKRNDRDNLDNRIQSNEELLLKNLHNQNNGAPYHLINATVNLPSSNNRWLRGRGADFFLFSKLYCGSHSTGYCKSDAYVKGKIKLATAMAISGAAASPRMGIMSSDKRAFLFTLLNIRLNRWMPNPNPKREPMTFFLPYYYLKELLSQGNEFDKMLNLSDGGHIENLGIYQLLRRKCGLIIASDAGADPEFRFDDLANLIAKARIDLGIEINIDLKKLYQDPVTRTTKSVCAFGKIHYPDNTIGVLLYFKTCITGSEPEDILSYRKLNPLFPHQSTTDQFFDETQFESYRELGYTAVKSVFG